MRILVTLLLIFGSLQTINSQARLGNSLEEIQEEFFDYGIRKTLCNDSLNALSFKIQELTVIYYFDKYDVCISTLVSITNKNVAQQIRNYYNKNYIIVDNYTWKVTENLTVAYITSYYDKVFGYIFIWDYESSELWLQEHVLVENTNSLQVLIKE